MLRRTHDHHRDLRTRLNASLSANAANRDQDRYLMITVPAAQIQSPHLSRWSSIRHGGARSNARLRPQLVHRSSSLETDTSAPPNPLIPANTVHHPPQSPRLPSPPPAPGACGATGMGRHPKTFTKEDVSPGSAADILVPCSSVPRLSIDPRDAWRPPHSKIRKFGTNAASPDKHQAELVASSLCGRHR